MPCHNPTHPTHKWVTEGVLKIWSCETRCGFCTGALAKRDWKKAGELRKHVKSHAAREYPKLEIYSSGRKLEYFNDSVASDESSESSDSGSEDGPELRTTSMSATQQRPVKRLKTYSSQVTSTTTTATEIDSQKLHASVNTKALEFYAAQFRAWLQFGEATGFEPKQIYELIVKESKDFFEISDD